MPNEVATTGQPRGITALLAERFEMDPKQFLQTLKATVMPSKSTNEECAAFMMVCHEHGLNPMLREIYAFPKKGGGISNVVGLDGWAKKVTGHPEYDGMEFEYDNKEDGTPDSVTCTLYRKNCSHPTTITEYYDECYRNTDPWNKMPKRMLRHKALMQCGRIAFGITGLTDEDEANDIKEVDATVVQEDPLAAGKGSIRKKKPVPEPEPKVEVEVKPKEEEKEKPAPRKRKPRKAVIEPPPPELTAEPEPEPEPAPPEPEPEEVEAEPVTPEEFEEQEERKTPPSFRFMEDNYEGYAEEIDAALDQFGLPDFCSLNWKKLEADEILMMNKAANRARDLIKQG